jgi:hypothetical protein
MHASSMSPRPPLVAGLVAACLASPATASATTPAQAIANLNAQRAANGLPADVVENPEWSEGCRLHNIYRAANGWGANPHDEDPALPHYTELGRRAARSSVLGSSGWPADGTNPWEDAPIHLMQVLAPDLAVTGWADGCMWTWPGYTRRAPEQPTLLSYPGDGTTIYAHQRATEWPFTPGEFVGLGGALTGPHLYVFAPGTRRARISAASLTGPGGPVEVRTVDNHTPELGPYLPSGGIVIPAAPLRPGARYSASVTVTADRAAPLVRRWTFRTRESADLPAGPPRPRAAGVRIGARVRGGRLTIHGGRAAGQRARLVLRTRGARASLARTVRLAPRTRVRLPGGARHVRVTVSVPAFSAGGVLYRATTVRRTVTR